MLKTAAGVAALLTVATAVSTVTFVPEGVRVGSSLVSESFLQLREADNGSVLVSANAVESLGGGAAVDVGGGRSISIEPGVRVTRIENGYRLSTHGRRVLSLRTGSGEASVLSPAVVTASEGGWTLSTGETLDGLSIAASIPVEATVTAVADNGDGSPGADSGGGSSATRPRSRRVLVEDRTVTSEATDEQTLKRTDDVSPSGF